MADAPPQWPYEEPIPELTPLPLPPPPRDSDRVKSWLTNRWAILTACGALAAGGFAFSEKLHSYATTDALKEVEHDLEQVDKRSERIIKAQIVIGERQVGLEEKIDWLVDREAGMSRRRRPPPTGQPRGQSVRDILEEPDD